MEVDLTQVAETVWPAIVSFFEQSIFFATLKFFLLVYVGVLFVDIVLLLILRGISGDLKTALYGAERPLVSTNKMIKRWEAIRDRLESDQPFQYKVAVLEADALANEVLDGIGYKGATMAEQLSLVKGGQLETKELLLEAHEVRNQIVHDVEYVLSREDAKKYLDDYQKFFDEVELF